MARFFPILVWLLAAAAAGGCTQVSVAAEAPREDFPVAVASVQTITLEREFVAEVQAAQRAEIRARTTGVVEAVAVDEGQDVTPGQVLFAMSARELDQELRRARAAVATAAAELKAAELELGNSKALLDRGVVAPAEAAQARAKVSALAARLAEAKAIEAGAAVKLTYTEIRAPFAGKIHRIQRKVGSLVQEGDLLSTLTNASDLRVYFRISESDYLDQLGGGPDGRRPVGFRLANGAAYPLAGEIDAVDGEVDRSTGTLTLRARFANPQGILRHGATGKVVVRSELTDALLVPQKATFEVQEHVYVYVVGADGVAKLRRITPRARHGDTFVVASGLAPGERFVLEGIQRVRDGAQLSVHVAAATPAQR